MKTTTLLCSAILSFSSSVWAQAQYQVTGPIVELTDSKIIVAKDTAKWEIARTPETKVDGNLKVGSRVTIQYTMQAASIAARSAKKTEPVEAKSEKEKTKGKSADNDEPVKPKKSKKSKKAAPKTDDTEEAAAPKVKKTHRKPASTAEKP